MPPNLFICRDATSWPGCSAGPGRRPAPPPRGRRGTPRPARRCRSAGPSAPRASSARAASATRRTGPATAPMAFWWKASCSARSRSRTTSAPPTTSEWPPQYFVVECTTTSAPRVSGCWRYGDAKVLSTTSSAPASCAIDGERLDVADVEQRVGRRLDPDQPGLAGPDRGPHRVEVGDRGGVVPQPPRVRDLGEEPVGAAVRVVGDDHVVARPAQRPQQGVLGREPAGEREAALALLERGDVALERGAGGVGGAAVLVAAAQAADAVLLVGAGRVDRRDHRPGRRVGLVAGVDRTRLEAGLRWVCSLTWQHAIAGRAGREAPLGLSGRGKVPTRRRVARYEPLTTKEAVLFNRRKLKMPTPSRP